MQTQRRRATTISYFDAHTHKATRTKSCHSDMGSRPSFKISGVSINCLLRQRCAAARTVVHSNPHQCLWTHDLQVHESKRDRCHADLYTVNLSKKARNLALKPRADITKTVGISGPQKGLVSSKKLSKETYKKLIEKLIDDNVCPENLIRLINIYVYTGFRW